MTANAGRTKESNRTRRASRIGHDSEDHANAADFAETPLQTGALQHALSLSLRLRGS